MTLILASSSPRRRELLCRLPIPFEVYPSGIDERAPQAGEAPGAYALDLARDKAANIAARRAEDTVLAADTVVALDGEFFGKPVDAADAARMLSRLRGKTHQVVTAVVAVCQGQQHVGVESSDVTMFQFGGDELNRYVATGEPMGKAGAYAVQGLGGSLVARVNGCYNNVVGLPLCITVDLLRKCGVTVPDRQDVCGHS